MNVSGTSHRSLGLRARNLSSREAQHYGLSQPHGVWIDGFLDGSAAERAGLRTHDVIIAADGAEVTELDDLVGILAGIAPDASLLVQVVREGQPVTVDVPLVPADGLSEQCPFCAEVIHPGAVKCKHCGEFLVAGAHSSTVSASRGRREQSTGLVVAGYVTAFLFPIAGFVIGIVLVVREQVAHGVVIIGASVLASVLWSFLL